MSAVHSLDELEQIAISFAKMHGPVYAKRWLEAERAKRAAKPKVNPYHTPQQPPLNLSPETDQELSRVIHHPKSGKPSEPPSRLDTGPVSVQALADMLAAPWKDTLHETTFKIYRTLLEVALITAQRRHYHPKVTHVTFHCPQEIVADSLKMHRSTVWRHVKTLRKHGLVHAREHKGTLRGETRNTGMVWQVRLHPTRGKAAKLAFDELKHKWRDLDADVKKGRTTYNQLHPVQQSDTPKANDRDAVICILAWSLPHCVNETTSSLTVANNLESLLDLPYAPKEARGEMVDSAAKSICFALGDGGGEWLNFYRKLCWNLLRRHDRNQDYFEKVHLMVLRVRADVQEGFAECGPALLYRRLTRWAVWEELQRTPMYRVGVAPMKA